MKKILFILKRKPDYNNAMPIGVSTGLYNSASFVNDLLTSNHINSSVSVVIDANSIDREVHLNKPTHVIIEALWVTPAKFTELIKLHPKVTWIVRLHSEIPFLANEGMAMEWLGDYSISKNIIISVNSRRMLKDMIKYISFSRGISKADASKKVIYLPNYYPDNFKKKIFSKKNHIDIGCFGAIRPMKNHLTQAIAAIDAAEKLGVQLRFHINGDRIEMKGSPVLHNLEGLFQHVYNRGHRLISHEWTERNNFLKICSEMDVGMQVSFSETFNIVAADFISQGIPVVGSHEIPWTSCIFNASTTDSSDICKKIILANKYSQMNVFINRYLLRNYINTTKDIWLSYFRN